MKTIPVLVVAEVWLSGDASFLIFVSIGATPASIGSAEVEENMSKRPRTI